MTAVLLGLGAALAYGIGDFLGGWLSRRVHYALVAVISYTVAFAVTIVVLALSAPRTPAPEALLWGAASGAGGAIGTLALFRGLGRGRMGIVAPLSAVGAAALPVLIGVALGDRPSMVAWLGVLLALPAIWLVSTSGRSEEVSRAAGSAAPAGSAPPAEATDRPGVNRTLAPGVIDGLVAGVAFALLFVGLGLAGEDSGLWPVLAGQGTALVVLVVITAGSLRRLEVRRPSSRDLGWAAVVGALGVAAVVLYFWSTHEGLLSIVAVLTSLYPAVTVLLAAGVLHEAISRRQLVGLALAATAVVFIVLG